MKKILLIEDNIEMRENTAEILELSNYEVVTAENGKVGIRKARETRPDLILCDIMMPEMDGYSVLYALSRDTDTAGIPFIFLTAKADRQDIRKGMTLGADDYLTKPFDEMELLDAIESRFKRSAILSKNFDNDIDGLHAFLDEARGKQALKNLSKDRHIRNFRAKDDIYHDGAYPGSLFFIISGKVKTWQMNTDGKELITGLHGPGDFLGYLPLLTGAPYSDTATALEDTELSLIPKADFLELIHQDRDVAYRLIRMLARDQADKEERLLSLAYSSLRARVATALLRLRERYAQEGGPDFSMRIARDDLAGIAGTATESLIRTLSEFRSDGLIQIAGREITILDPKGLERVRELY